MVVPSPPPPPPLPQPTLRPVKLAGSAATSAASGPSMAVDGIASSCLVTKPTASPWVSMDLGKKGSVGSVVLVSKGVHDVEVRVGSTAPSATAPSTK